MPQHSRLASFVVGAFCVGHLYAQGLSQWKDPSTHSTRFVTVDKNVQVELLDWGGLGRSIILLAAVALPLTSLTTSRQSSLPAGMFTASRGADSVHPVIQPHRLRLNGSAKT